MQPVACQSSWSLFLPGPSYMFCHPCADTRRRRARPVLRQAMPLTTEPAHLTKVATACPTGVPYFGTSASGAVRLRGTGHAARLEEPESQDAASGQAAKGSAADSRPSESKPGLQWPEIRLAEGLSACACPPALRRIDLIRRLHLGCLCCAKERRPVIVEMLVRRVWCSCSLPHQEIPHVSFF